MELYLGINFEDHDTAVFFMDLEKKDVFAISTERITRFKHDKVFPIPAMDAVCVARISNESASGGSSSDSSGLSREAGSVPRATDQRM